jgi:hypothetical protein
MRMQIFHRGQTEPRTGGFVLLQTLITASALLAIAGTLLLLFAGIIRSSARTEKLAGQITETENARVEKRLQ